MRLGGHATCLLGQKWLTTIRLCPIFSVYNSRTTHGTFGHLLCCGFLVSQLRAGVGLEACDGQARLTSSPCRPPPRLAVGGGLTA